MMTMSPSNSKNPIICWCSPVCPAWSARWSFWSEARSPCPASGRPRPAPSRSPFGGSLCLVVGMGIIKGAKLQHLPPPRKFERAFENTVETSPPSRKSMSRPGVAITISAPFSMSRNWERCQSLKFDTFDTMTHLTVEKSQTIPAPFSMSRNWIYEKTCLPLGAPP